jgi:hypothetical protein
MKAFSESDFYSALTLLVEQEGYTYDFIAICNFFKRQI